MNTAAFGRVLVMLVGDSALCYGESNNFSWLVLITKDVFQTSNAAVVDLIRLQAPTAAFGTFKTSLVMSTSLKKKVRRQFFFIAYKASLCSRLEAFKGTITHEKQKTQISARHTLAVLSVQYWPRSIMLRFQRYGGSARVVSALAMAPRRGSSRPRRA
jgi:hypothetical protein